MIHPRTLQKAKMMTGYAERDRSDNNARALTLGAYRALDPIEPTVRPRAEVAPSLDHSTPDVVASI
jgi:hypothetical protein